MCTCKQCNVGKRRLFAWSLLASEVYRFLNETTWLSMYIKAPKVCQFYFFSFFTLLFYKKKPQKTKTFLKGFLVLVFVRFLRYWYWLNKVDSIRTFWHTLNSWIFWQLICKILCLKHYLYFKSLLISINILQYARWEISFWNVNNNYRERRLGTYLNMMQKKKNPEKFWI